MSLFQWILLNSFLALFWLWVLCWGGARWIEGLKSIFIINIFSIKWNSEQIRLYALCMLAVNLIWFAVGVFIPELRVLDLRHSS